MPNDGGRTGGGLTARARLTLSYAVLLAGFSVVAIVFVYLTDVAGSLI